MNISAIIPTYADRYLYLETVVSSLLKQHLHKIIIINNNSVPESTAKLIDLQQKNEKIEVISFDKNSGSASAFNIGIKKALDDPDCEFVWLLDDDNLPDNSALDILADMWGKLSQKNNDIILSSWRTIKDNYLKAVKFSNPDITLGEKNGFRSFHIVESFKQRKSACFNDLDYGEVFSVPYGGMFFHKELINKIGLFDNNYFVYLDDTEFCMKHRINGGAIYCVLSSKINDLEISCYNNGRTIVNFATKEMFFQIYYYVRNRVYFEKKYLITSWPVYFLNMFIYSVAVTGIALVNLKFKNIKTYYTALWHGLTGKMGYNEKYSLD